MKNSDSGTQTLTERQIREKAYYDQFAVQYSNNLNEHIDFAPIDGPMLKNERRPWNTYWRTYEVAIDLAKTGSRLLDFGCGAGDNSIRFSRAGHKVTGFDISENNILSCKKLFEKNNIEGEFLVTVAEKLPFADETFDVVAGIDILHHVDIPTSVREVRRVLKKDGVAVFREPIEVPLFDIIRNTKLIKAIFPNSVSFETHITEDERKLNNRDLEILREIFPRIKIERSLMLSRFDKFIRKQSNPTPSFLERLDYVLAKIIPAYARLGGAAVIILSKHE
jgi:2-polyprenyl-3-methyl-5-hydroxy-6-metoxy-1,4-benzoquinol methylase